MTVNGTIGPVGCPVWGLVVGSKEHRVGQGASWFNQPTEEALAWVTFDTVTYAKRNLVVSPINAIRSKPVF